jgi:hypothetical protein
MVGRQALTASCWASSLIFSRSNRGNLVGGRGHYLNSRIDLGSGVLDLIRTHCDRLEMAAAGV